MATPLTSDQNDTFQVSIYKMAYNFWILAAAAGYTGEAPDPSASYSELLQLTVDYTAILS